jgi:large subunit ribosomal protein L13
VDTLSYKTISVNKENADKKWLVVDAEGQTLGRFASRVAIVLRGKHKPSFTPHADTGDNVIVINAEKITISGNKALQKEYIRHTNYPGGQRTEGFESLQAKHPERIVEKAVKGMLPKNRLGREFFRNLFVYAGTEHPHEGQKPETFNINSIK